MLRNNKGIAVIYIALMILVLIAFVGLSVDISYMYVAKGQLHKAADAAALAGVAKLSENSTDPLQTAPRIEAQNFAGKNRAAGTNVAIDLNAGNDPNGDIVLGNWDATRIPHQFLPDTDGTPLPLGTVINAVKVVARRTGASGAGQSPNPQVSIFFGKVVGWFRMSAAAQAIALRNPPPIIAFPICLPNCNDPNNQTSLLPVHTNADGSKILGTKFFFNQSDGPPFIAWTSFLDKNTSNKTIEGYITGATQPPDICSLLTSQSNCIFPNITSCGNTVKCAVCLFTTNGVVTPADCEMLDMIRKNARHHDVNGTDVFGWKVFLPILNKNSNACNKKNIGCFSDPGYQPGDAFTVVKLAPVIVTGAQVSGNCPKLANPPPPDLIKDKPALIIVGTGPGIPGISSTILCQCCDSLKGVFGDTARLVQ